MQHDGSASVGAHSDKAHAANFGIKEVALQQRIVNISKMGNVKNFEMWWQVWHEYELAPLRALVKDEDISNVLPGEGARSKEGMFAPPKLLWRSILASLQGIASAGAGQSVGQDAFILLTHQCKGVCKTIGYKRGTQRQMYTAD